MLCPNCKKEIPDDCKFCGNCGKTLIAENVSNESAPTEPVPAPTPTAAEETKGGGCLKPLIILIALIVALVFLINACSGDDDDDYDAGGYEYEDEYDYDYEEEYTYEEPSVADQIKGTTWFGIDNVTMDEAMGMTSAVVEYNDYVDMNGSNSVYIETCDVNSVATICFNTYYFDFDGYTFSFNSGSMNNQPVMPEFVLEGVFVEAQKIKFNYNNNYCSNAQFTGTFANEEGTAVLKVEEDPSRPYINALKISFTVEGQSGALTGPALVCDDGQSVEVLTNSYWKEPNKTKGLYISYHSDGTLRMTGSWGDSWYMYPQ